MAATAFTPPLLGATPVLVVSMLANGALLAWALATGRAAVSRDVGVPLAWRLAAAAVVALFGMAGCGWWFGLGERAVAPVAGLVLGAFAAAALQGREHDGPRAAWAGEAAPLAGGLLLLALLGLVFAPGVPLANAAIGLVTGWSGVALATEVLPARAPEADAPALAPGMLALAAGAGAWGEKLWVDGGAGWPLAIALGTLATAAIALAGAAVGEERPGLARLVAGAAWAIAACALAAGGYAVATPLLIAILAGAAAGTLLPLLLAERADLAGLGRLAFLLAGGALLVLDNRLLGILAIGFGGLGLATGGVPRGARAWVALLVALFAARVWIQLYLDRTALTGYGVDLTHPYGFAGLIAGALLPGAAIAARAALGGDRALCLATAVGLVSAPAWVGYFMHAQAAAAWLAGLAIAVFALAAAERRASALPVTLLLGNVGLTLLAAPWLVTVMNASRQDRVIAVAVAAAIAAGLAAWWWLARGRVAPVPGEA